MSHWRKPRDPRREEFLDRIAGFLIIAAILGAVAYLAAHLPPS